ncbi:MAG TPA: histidine phosphatase family protein [Actinomycetota bacterium]|nr:histidine phosphatase family protein [Actinomycetota bacterium]
MGSIFLIRHGEAGRRSEWTAPDHLRPLTAQGEQQALGLVPLLSAAGAGPVLSSPYVRCVQSVEPLAAALGVAIEEAAWLAEGASPAAALDRLAALPDPAYACTHGDVVEGILGILGEAGVLLDGRSGNGEETRKGATWVLERAGVQGESRIAAGRLLPPPA